ncbi:MAG: hypothetical protein AB9872_17215 [Solidesulfovibrio sp.]
MARQAVYLIFALILLLTGSMAVSAAEAPTNLAGITLGEEAGQFKGRVQTTTARNVDNAPWLRRMAVVPDKFFSSGYVLVGSCAAPGRVARIKMHYRDDSLEFYRKINGEMLSRYGDPAEYKGEIDGRIMGNKWAFSDSRLRPISLIVQRLEGEDPETGGGNTVKLTNWGLLEAERACWQERHGAKPPKNAPKPGKPGQDNGYLPR